MTVAQEHDDWFCENFIDLPHDLPDGMTREQAVEMMKEILGKDNNDVIEVIIIISFI